MITKPEWKHSGFFVCSREIVPCLQADIGLFLRCKPTPLEQALLYLSDMN